MDFSYVVLLKPSEICFTTNFVKERFDNNIALKETLTQLQKGEILVDDIPFIEVIWYQEKWEMVYFEQQETLGVPTARKKWSLSANQDAQGRKSREYR